MYRKNGKRMIFAAALTVSFLTAGVSGRVYAAEEETVPAVEEVSSDPVADPADDAEDADAGEADPEDDVEEADTEEADAEEAGTEDDPEEQNAEEADPDEDDEDADAEAADPEDDPEEQDAEEADPEDDAEDADAGEAGAEDPGMEEEGSTEKGSLGQGAAAGIVSFDTAGEAAREQAAREQAAREQVSRDQAAKEQAASDRKALESAADEKESENLPKQAPAENAQNGWVDDGNYKMYYVNGEAVKNKVLTIDGKLYAFNSASHLIQNKAFTINVDEGTFRGRARQDGSLYCSQWYEQKQYISAYDKETILQYYYGADGQAMSQGIHTIGGKDYLFYSDGYLATGMCIYVDGVYYAADKNGYPVVLSGNGWKEVGGAWFYLRDGVPLSLEIIEHNGKKYAFSYYRYMYSNENFTLNGNTYHANPDGSLLTGSWYQDRVGRWYYADETGALVTGIQKLGKTLYYFKSSHVLAVDTSFTISDGEYQGTYVSDANGKAYLVKEGWNNVGTEYYYFQNGELLKNGIHEVGGKFYYFDSQGAILKNAGLSISYSNKQYIRAKANGVLYRNEWYHDPKGGWFYYGDDCYPVCGKQTIKGKTYFFSTSYSYTYSSVGLMLTSTFWSDDGDEWVIDSNGVACLGVEEEWIQCDGKWYFFRDGDFVVSRTVQIKDKYYGFNEYGVLYRKRRFYVGGSYYRSIDNTGALLQDTWYGNEYYSSNASAPSSFREIKDKLYFFRDGVAVVNEYVIYSGELLYHAGSNCVLTPVTQKGIYYVLDSRGHVYTTYLQENGTLLKNAWLKVSGSWFYFGEDGRAAYNEAYIEVDGEGRRYYLQNDGTLRSEGWNRLPSGDWVYLDGKGMPLTGGQRIDDTWYYFDQYGRMQTGVVTLDSGIFLYRSNGTYAGKLKSDGWTTLDGAWFYAENGSVVRNGERTIKGKRYRFYNNGRMITDVLYDKTYYGADGAALEAGWFKYYEDWYYVDPETHKLAERLTEIKGKKYYFDVYSGRMMTGEILEGEVCYKTNAKGQIISEEEVSDGWYLSENEWYYYENGDYVDGWKGDYFFAGGEMIRGSVYYGYLFGEDGKWIKKPGLVKFARQYRGTDIFYAENDYYYIKDDKYAAMEEWIRLNGKWYYFGSTGRMETYPFIKNGNLYLVDANTGELLNTIKNADDGWYEYMDSWIYVRDGKICSDQFTYAGKVYNTLPGYAFLNGVGYSYYSDGRDQVFYHGANGAAQLSYTGLKTINGKKWYFGKNGSIYMGWTTINGKTYYTHPELGIVTGWITIGGQLYHFDSNGVMTEQVHYTNGWINRGGDLYYYENGSLSMRNLVEANGKTYLLYAGKLIKDGFVVGYMGGYASDSDGVLIRNTWKKGGIGWYYFGDDGRTYTGCHVINGKNYYFDSEGLLMN